MGGRVKWDEANLGEIEANKPVRQKITEPKTPYHRMIDDDEGLWDTYEEGNGDAIHSEVISSDLSDMASSSENNSRRSGWISSEDEVDIMDQDDEGSGSERNKSFREQRRSHYDEYRRIKELRLEGSSLEEVSDDETEDLDKRDGRCTTSSSLTAAVKSINIAEGSTNDSK